MNRLTQILLLILCAIVGCSLPSGPTDLRLTQPAFYAQVLDENAQPIGSVSIQCYFYSTSKSDQPYVVTGSVGIIAHARDSSTVNLFIRPLGKSLPIDTICDNGGGGLRILRLNTTLYRNGFYDLMIQGADSIWTEKCLFQNWSNGLIYDSTDLRGKFVLQYDDIGASKKFNPPFSVDSVEVVLYKPGFRSIDQAYVIDTLKPFQHVFILSSL